MTYFSHCCEWKSKLTQVKQATGSFANPLDAPQPTETYRQNESHSTDTLIHFQHRCELWACVFILIDITSQLNCNADRHIVFRITEGFKANENNTMTTTMTTKQIKLFTLLSKQSSYFAFMFLGKFYQGSQYFPHEKHIKQSTL